MGAASNARQTNKTSATGARRSGEPHTVTPTRTRVRAAKSASRGTRRPAGRGTSGPVAAHDGDGKGRPLWEDDGGAMPPEEWS